MIVKESQGADSSERLTLGVLFYNQEAFAEQAVQGALAQTYSPLEIVFSDDASTDNTFRAIQRAIEGYDGPHKVVLNRNEKNLGLVGNVNRVVKFATGEIIVLAAGDDVSMPNRVARSAEVLAAADGCLCVSFGRIPFEGVEIPTETDTRQSEEGCTRYTMTDYVSGPRFYTDGATRAYRRAVFDFFGPMGSDCPIEDLPLLLRSFLLGDALVVPEPQVFYRVHEGGISQFGKADHFDREVIYRQYLRDLDVAAERGLLADDERGRLESVLALRRDRRIFVQDLHNASSRLAALKVVSESKVNSVPKKLHLALWVLKSWRRR